MLHGMFIRTVVIFGVLMSGACSGEPDERKPEVKSVQPSELSLGDYSHESLPDELLSRIRGITDVFEPIDGISYEQAVDLYKRDQNPETEIAVWEEMALAYEAFCKSESCSLEKRQEAYKALLLASMLPEDQVFSRLQPTLLTLEDVRKLNLLFTLDPQPIKVSGE